MSYLKCYGRIILIKIFYFVRTDATSFFPKFLRTSPMPKRFLNVEYSGTKTEVDITEAERLGEVQDAVKAKYGPAMAQVGAAQLLFYDQQNQHISKWALLKSLPQEYFDEEGLFLVVHGPKQESVSGSNPPRSTLVATQAVPAMAPN